MTLFLSYSAKESRLIYEGDLRQLGRDINDYHIRADDPLAAAGSVVLAPAAGISKFGNALVGEFSDAPAEPLGEGGLKYISRDIRSAGTNLLAAGKNLVTLHPIKATGNVLKAGFDGVDVVLVDPLLDIGSGAFGHNNRKTRYAVSQTLATAA